MQNNCSVIGNEDNSESRFPSDVDKDEWEEEQKVFVANRCNPNQLELCPSVPVPHLSVLKLQKKAKLRKPCSFLTPLPYTPLPCSHQSLNMFKMLFS